MITVSVDTIGDLRIVECDGRIGYSQAISAIRDSVIAQSGARVIVVDLSEVNALEGGGLGVMISLQQWAQDHKINFKLFNPRSSVRASLENTKPPVKLEIVSLNELLLLLHRADHIVLEPHKEPRREHRVSRSATAGEPYAADIRA